MNYRTATAVMELRDFWNNLLNWITAQSVLDVSASKIGEVVEVVPKVLYIDNNTSVKVEVRDIENGFPAISMATYG
jgi:hypothetical protein